MTKSFSRPAGNGWRSLQLPHKTALAQYAVQICAEQLLGAPLARFWQWEFLYPPRRRYNAFHDPNGVFLRKGLVSKLLFKKKFADKFLLSSKDLRLRTCAHKHFFDDPNEANDEQAYDRGRRIVIKAEAERDMPLVGTDTFFILRAITNVHSEPDRPDNRPRVRVKLWMLGRVTDVSGEFVVYGNRASTVTLRKKLSSRPNTFFGSLQSR